MGEHLDAELDAARDDATAQRPIGKGAEGDLDRVDRRDTEREVELPSRDVRQPDPPDKARPSHPFESAHGGDPRYARIGRVQEVRVDGKAPESLDAGLAVLAYRARAPVGLPTPLGPTHPALRENADGSTAKRSRQGPLVVTELRVIERIRARRVEHR